MSIVGIEFRDPRDGEEGYILREVGPMVFSALMNNGEVRYYLRKPGQIEVIKKSRDR